VRCDIVRGDFESAGVRLRRTLSWRATSAEMRLASTEALHSLPMMMLLAYWRRTVSAHATEGQRVGAAMLRVVCEVTGRTYEWRC
jgi:hypothetical protein